LSQSLGRRAELRAQEGRRVFPKELRHTVGPSGL
jgi:hypothetical protein